MAQNHKRPVQASDALGRPLTTLAEGTIQRVPVAADGAWHRVAAGVEAVRLHVFPTRKGVLYTTSKASAVQDGDPVDADTVAASLPLAAGGTFLLTFAGGGDVFLAVDPDAEANLAAPLVGVVQSAGA